VRALQADQASADDRWGFDFPLLDALAAPQLSIEYAGLPPLPVAADAEQRRMEYVVLALAGEVGELANLVKKRRRALLMGEAADPSLEPRIQDECADVFAYLLKLCNLRGWDLERLYAEKMARNEARFSRRG
jgi:NTP pyrophosphatase (non-canonical NTP hydrolase)